MQPVDGKPTQRGLHWGESTARLADQPHTQKIDKHLACMSSSSAVMTSYPNKLVVFMSFRCLGPKYFFFFYAWQSPVVACHIIRDTRHCDQEDASVARFREFLRINTMQPTPDYGSTLAICLISSQSIRSIHSVVEGTS
jgi:hypothetical protein